MSSSFDLSLAAGSAVEVGGFSSPEYVMSFVGGFGVAMYDEATATDVKIPIALIAIRVAAGSNVSVQCLPSLDVASRLKAATRRLLP
jgi:hypothetical protein